MNRTAVIADDEEILLTMQNAYLPRKGYTVVGESRDGSDLVALALQHQPDLLLTDNNMPRIEGIDAVTALRAQGYTRPIVMNSGKTIDLVQADPCWTIVEQGQWYHPGLKVHLIAKPYGLTELGRIIDRATNPQWATPA